MLELALNVQSPSKPREITPGTSTFGFNGSNGNEGTVLFCCWMSKYETLSVNRPSSHVDLTPASCCRPVFGANTEPGTPLTVPVPFSAKFWLNPVKRLTFLITFTTTPHCTRLALRLYRVYAPFSAL